MKDKLQLLLVFSSKACYLFPLCPWVCYNFINEIPLRRHQKKRKLVEIQFHNLNKVKANFVYNNECTISIQKGDCIGEKNGDTTP